MNKKWLVILMMFVAMMFAVSGCGKKGDEAVVGTWKVSIIEMGGQTIEWSEYEEQAQATGMDTTMEMIVEKDGTFSANFAGTKAAGTWKGKANSYTLTSDGSDQTATLKDGKLIMEEKSLDATLTMEKE